MFLSHHSVVSNVLDVVVDFLGGSLVLKPFEMEADACRQTVQRQLHNVHHSVGVRLARSWRELRSRIITIGIEHAFAAS